MLSLTPEGSAKIDCYQEYIFLPNTKLSNFFRQRKTSMWCGAEISRTFRERRQDKIGHTYLTMVRYRGDGGV